MRSSGLRSRRSLRVGATTAENAASTAPRRPEKVAGCALGDADDRLKLGSTFEHLRDGQALDDVADGLRPASIAFFVVSTSALSIDAKYAFLCECVQVPVSYAES